MSKTLTVYLAADLRKFTGPLNRAGNQAQGFSAGIGRLGSSLTSMLGPALIGAGIAAGALAVSLGVDGVKAAMEDEAAAAKLAKTMENLGLAQDTTAAEASIDVMQRQYGVADSLLRPGLDRLIRSLGDTAKATEALDLAVQISTVTGRSLDSVVQALAKGYDGNTAGLARLGAGIDSATLKTGDMALITAKLSETFAGQAKAASQTYEGQLKRLAVGFDELKEAFGTGFLNGLGDANDTTNELMKSMQDLEPEVKRIGETAANTAIGVVKGTDAMITFGDNVRKVGDYLTSRFSISLIRNADALNLISDEAGAAAEAEYELYLANHGLIGQMDPIARGLYAASTRWQAYADSIRDAQAASSNFALTTGELQKVISPTVSAALAAGQATSLYGGKLVEYGKAVEDVGTSSIGTTTSTDRLSTAFELQSKVVADGSEKLKRQTAELEAANAAVDQYASTLSGQLLGGIDLSAAQETGTELGTGTMAAFEAQIAQANWFGNVLEEVKRQNGSQALIDYMAQAGPAAGGKFGQEAIDNGLIPEFSSKLDAVVASANQLAQAMVPEGLRAGVDLAEAGLQGIADTFSMNSDKLAKIGKRMGKTIGDNSRVEILKAVADAIGEAEASRTAAEARNRATTAAANLLSDQQVAQAFSRIIQTSNSRTGYSMGVPIPSPVLG
jgi:hypothetical protein